MCGGAVFINCSSVSVSVHRMDSFHNSGAEPGREVLKVLIRGYVQAKLASQRQWGDLIGEATVKWETFLGGIPFVLTTTECQTEEWVRVG